MPNDRSVWALHDTLRRLYHEDPVAFRRTKSRWDAFLRVKYRLASKSMASCDVCEWRCQVDRAADRTGVCGVGRTSSVFAEKLSFGEELELVPAYRVEFSGCNMRCGHCNVGETVLNPALGRRLAPRRLAERMTRAWQDGAKSLYVLGGEPIVHLVSIIRTVRALPSEAPLVIHTNGYETPSGLALLEGLAQTMIVDLKFGPGECAERCAATPRYWETLTRNLLAILPSTSLIVRHVALPGHLDCCTQPILRWMSVSLPRARLSLASKFVPVFPIRRTAEMDRLISSEERGRMEEWVRASGVRVAA